MKQELTILGVPGTLEQVPHATNPALWAKQVWKSQPRAVTFSKHIGPQSMTVTVRYDDQCGNRVNSFSITADVPDTRQGGGMGGCLHKEIAQVFPELAPLIKWHMMNSDGPTHYLANTTFMAGDRDHHGKRKGEPWAWDNCVKFGQFPITFKLNPRFSRWLEVALEHQASTLKGNPHRRNFEIVEIPYKGGDGHTFSPKYSFDDYTAVWHECPFDTRREAEQFKEAIALGVEFLKVPTLFSEGKERDLDAARRTAIWPEATDEQLCLPKAELTKLLEERLPGLIEQFRTELEATGLKWAPGLPGGSV